MTRISTPYFFDKKIWLISPYYTTRCIKNVVQLSHCLKINKDGIQDFEALSSGFYVAVTNNSNKPIIKYEGIEASVGYVTNIGITRSFYNKMPSPYGDCRDNIETPMSTDSDYYKYTVLLGKYTRNQCFEICFQYKFVIPNCNCSDASVSSNVNNVSVCTFGPEQKCVQSQRSFFGSADCNSDCPETCERVDYSYKVSMSSYPTM